MINDFTKFAQSLQQASNSEDKSQHNKISDISNKLANIMSILESEINKRKPIYEYHQQYSKQELETMIKDYDEIIGEANNAIKNGTNAMHDGQTMELLYEFQRLKVVAKDIISHIQK